MFTERGKRYGDEQREKLLELFRQSGLSAIRFCKERKVSYPTLKRWLGLEPSKSVRFDEIGEADSSGQPLSVALPNGLWPSFPIDVSKSVVSDWIRELKAC